MRVVFGTVAQTIAASPALAGGSSGVPAPLVGFGLPAMLAVGGVLLVSRFFKRK